MLIHVKGSTKDKRALAEKTVAWSIKKLGLNRMSSLSIDVVLRKMKKDEYGYCNIIESNRSFIIDVNKNVSLKDFVSTIIHEMVHVKQFARNEMSAYGMRWKTKTVSENTKYVDLPWEKEAYKLEAKLIELIWKENIL
jgi:phenylpyruvate tautomerase PptA (4-oxalocrotonate tautomerase family)